MLLVVDDKRPECVIPRPVRARTRLWTHLRASSLDRALAAGASPDCTASLSLRAAQLIRASTRRTLARSLQRVINDATRPPFPPGPGAIPCRRKVLAARELLVELAERLDGQEPVDARGVAQVRLLLVGVARPLYDRPRANDLAPALQAALEALDPGI